MAGPNSPWWQAFPVTSPFGDPDLVGGRRTRPSQHVDIGTPRGQRGTAVEPGQVIDKGFHNQLGNYVTVRGKSGDWIYFHAADVPVNVGDQVGLEDHLFTTGNTGASTGPHTSVRLIQDGRPVDPSSYLGISAGFTGGSGMPDNEKDKKPKANVTEPLPPPESALEDLQRRAAGIQQQGGGQFLSGGVGGQGFKDPRLNAELWNDPGAFFASLVGENPTLAVMRAMAQGGAPMFGGPAYLQDIAGQIAGYTDLLNLLNVGTGGFSAAKTLPGSFAELLAGGSGQGALNPQALGQLFERLLATSQGRTPIEQVMAATGGTGSQAQADELGRQQGVFEEKTGQPMGNILDFVLRDPQVVQGLLGVMGFGSGLAGKALQKYFAQVVSPQYKAFERELYPTASNPLMFLAQLMGGAPAAGRSGGPVGQGSTTPSESAPPTAPSSAASAGGGQSVGQSGGALTDTITPPSGGGGLSGDAVSEAILNLAQGGRDYSSQTPANLSAFSSAVPDWMRPSGLNPLKLFFDMLLHNTGLATSANTFRSPQARFGRRTFAGEE